MNNLKTLFLCIGILTLSGCSKDVEESAFEMQVDFMQVQPPVETNEIIVNDAVPEESKEKPQVRTSRKIIKEGFVEFETSDIEETKKQVMAAVSLYDAYVASDAERKMNNNTNYTLVVRVPSAKFDAFLSSATRNVSQFDEKRISVKDVTAEFIDTEIRLKTKKEIELRYLQLLQKASTVKDILNIEKEAGIVRTEIESSEGQLKLLTDQIRYSTLTIKFYKTSPVSVLFSSQIYAAFERGWEFLLAGFLMIISFWPFIILTLGLWILFAKMRLQRIKKSLMSKKI